MIRTPGRGPDLFETIQGLSTKLHEGLRRATKGLEKAQEGSAKGREGRKNFHDGRQVSVKEVKRSIHEGPRRTLRLCTTGTQVQEDQEIMFPAFGLGPEHESSPDSHQRTGFCLSILNILFLHVQECLIALSLLPRRQPSGRSGLIQVEEMAEAAPGFVRAGRPRSQEMIALDSKSTIPS